MSPCMLEIVNNSKYLVPCWGQSLLWNQQWLINFIIYHCFLLCPIGGSWLMSHKDGDWKKSLFVDFSCLQNMSSILTFAINNIIFNLTFDQAWSYMEWASVSLEFSMNIKSPCHIFPFIEGTDLRVKYSHWLFVSEEWPLYVWKTVKLW